MATLTDMFRWWLAFVLIRALVRVVPPNGDISIRISPGDSIMQGPVSDLQTANDRRAP